VLLAGHTGIGAGANLGLGASVHQRTSVGTGAMIGMGSVVTRDVPPFGKAYGNPARLRGVNATGMERSGLSAESVAAVAAAYAGGVPAISALRELALIPELAPSIDDWLRRIEP
jgi:UDP-N-acetylglucosamine acyltransferase